MNERRFGILIASSRFPDEPMLEDLRCPENDVDGLHEVLSSKDRGDFAETIVLKNQPHHEVLKNINQILRQAQKNDLVLIFYSGHGKLDLAGRLHLATVDTELDALESTSIPVESIRNFIDVSPSKKSVLLLDCCYSGAVEKALLRGGVQEQLQQVSGGRGIYILTGSTDIQVAQEKETDQYGLFSKHVIEGIRNGDADQDNDGLITMDDLYAYVHNKVLEEGPQEPMKWAVGVRGDLIISRSGKTPRKERRKQIREILGQLWTKGILPEDILDKARKVSALNPEQISGELRAYDDLLEQLIQKKVEVGEFISKWYKVGPKPLISISEKPALKPTEPKPDKPEPVKVKPLEPKPEAKATTKPRPSEPHKISRALKFGVLIAAAILITSIGFWLFSQQQVKEARQAMEKLKTQVLNLENAIAELDKPEQIDKLSRQRDTLSHQVGALREQASRVGLGTQLEELQNRLKQIQIHLANKEKEQIAAQKGRILVEFTPDNATVKILNIDETFQQGMKLEPGKYHVELEPGSYHVEVAAEGYETERRWIDLLAGHKEQFRFELAKIKVAEPTPPEKAITNSIGIKFVLIPAGRFTMGSRLSPEELAGRYGGEAEYYKDEQPPHHVEITKPFYLQTAELTQGQWKRIMGDNPSYFKDCGDDCPVEQVSWDMAQQFISKLNQMEGTLKYRLPTEAEWEYACRAETTTPFYTGVCISTVQANYDGKNPGKNCPKGDYRGKTVKVGSFRPNAWGLYDMHGNVWEWCQDWFGYYPSNSVVDPKGFDKGEYRVLRGGSWGIKEGGLRSAFRVGNNPDFRGSRIGFRVARDF
jgi:formylglycine-generating enzyme required for sulfatase activity